MIQLPGLIVSLVLASAYAAGVYLWRGRRLRDLLFFWLAAVVGFAAGQVVGQLLDLIPWTIGQVHVIEATLLAFLFLFMARWLTQENKMQDARDKQSKIQNPKSKT
jgi:ABC-type uncharacterized transport system permease subunit